MVSEQTESVSVAEVAALRHELATVKGQLKQEQAELAKLRLAGELTRHLGRELELDAASEIGVTLAGRAERTSTGRLRVDGPAGGLLADSPADLASMYLNGPGAYLRQTAGLSPSGGQSERPTAFDPAQIGDIDYARRWKELDPESFKVAWRKHLTMIASQPVKGA